MRFVGQIRCGNWGFEKSSDLPSWSWLGSDRSPGGTQAIWLHISNAFHSVALPLLIATEIVWCGSIWNGHKMGVLLRTVCIPLCLCLSSLYKSFSVSVCTCLFTFLSFRLFYFLPSPSFSLVYYETEICYFLRSFRSPALNLKPNNIHQNSFSCLLNFSRFMGQTWDRKIVSISNIRSERNFTLNRLFQEITDGPRSSTTLSYS